MKVFISHSSTDKKFVRTLKDCLAANNIDIWMDEDQLDLGDSLLTKLDQALNDSSHLVIILSPASIASDWVRFELKKAIENSRTGLMQKIIPVKFQECDIPEELSDMLYADLSNEVVLPAGDRLKFISDGFDIFFLKLVRALRNSAKAISTEEKREIISSIESSEEQLVKHSKQIFRANYELIGFNSKETQSKYIQRIKNANSSLKSDDVILPCLLPASFKNILNLNIGDVVKIETDMPFRSYAHFAGYRLDDLKIALDSHTRAELYMVNHKIYQVEVDPEKKTIRFVNNSEFVGPPDFPRAGEANYGLAA